MKTTYPDHRNKDIHRYDAFHSILKSTLGGSLCHIHLSFISISGVIGRHFFETFQESHMVPLSTYLSRRFKLILGLPNRLVMLLYFIAAKQLDHTTPEKMVTNNMKVFFDDGNAQVFVCVEKLTYLSTTDMYLTVWQALDLPQTTWTLQTLEVQSSLWSIRRCTRAGWIRSGMLLPTGAWERQTNITPWNCICPYTELSCHVHCLQGQLEMSCDGE